LKASSEAWVIVLLVYFSVLIAGSLAASVLIWKPTAQSSGANSTRTVYIPLSRTNNSATTSSAATFTPTTSNKTVYNNASGTVITNITLYTDMGKNLSKRIDVTYIIPSSSERETRLIELSLLFGIIGSSVHGVSSLTLWHSRKKLERSFFSWYLTRPLIGAALAVTSYLLLRSTLLTTVANGPGQGGIGFINDYGVAGVSALVGLMTAQMTQKLRDIFDAMFGIQKGTDKGDVEVNQENNIIITPKELQISVNKTSVLVAVVKDNANKAISGVNVDFGVVDSNVVKPLDSTQKKTDTNGMAVLSIQAIKGNGSATKIHAAIELEGKTIYTSSTVKVIDGPETIK
jgi:hypothetical protein